MKCKDEKYKINTKIPSFHIVGKNDEWYNEGKKFYNLFENSELYEHESGHNFPKENNIYQELKNWLNNL